MAFFGGFLKVLSIISLLVSTVICTVISVDSAVFEAYIVMGVIWAACAVTALTIWGVGLALTEVAKLKQKLQAMERKASRQVQEDPLLQEDIPAERPRYVGRFDNSNNFPRPRRTGKWVLIVALVLVALALVGGILWFVAGSIQGGSAQPPVPETVPEVIFYPEATEAPVELFPEAAVEEAPAAVQAEAITLGDPAMTDFVLMLFGECTVDEDIKLSVTTGNVTRTTGPEPLPGQQYICLEGRIQNTSTAPLPVYDFFNGVFDIDGYRYKVTANDCDVLTPDGQTVSNIDPLMEYDFRIYTAIPDALAESYSSCSFTFGFYDGFENQDLAYHRSFSDDPIAPCPYQYTVTIR